MKEVSGYKMLGKRATIEYYHWIVIRKLPFFILIFFLFSGFKGCPFPTDNTTSKDITQRTQDVSGKMALALGGVVSGWEILLLGESPNSLDYTTEDDDLLEVAVPSGFNSFIEAKGAKITPKDVGIGYVTPIVNTRERDPVQVTIPPQKLIQILVAEGHGQLVREAILDDGGQTKGSSMSVTGNALGGVIRNRVRLILETESPSLFKVDPAAFETDPPLSYYEGVIEGEDQFNPVNPDDPSHDRYLEAADRTGLVDEEDRIAYDQALLTAAGIFNEGTGDPTGEAFAFYTPDESEWEILQDALQSGTLNLPEGAGTSDARFPSLAPVQVLILGEVASATSTTDRPSFVFVRERDPMSPAVTDIP